MRAGRLDTTITIKRDTLTGTDDFGVPIYTTTTVATPRAQVIQTSTEEFIRGFGASDETVTVFRTRWIAGITNADKIEHGGKVFNIKELKPIGRNRGLELRAVAFA